MTSPLKDPVEIDLTAELLTDLRDVISSNVEPAGVDEFLEDGVWKCTACGACCEDVRWCLPGWMVPGTTRCKHLQEDKLCAIYETRPWVCRMRTFEVWKLPHRNVAKACAFMRNKFYGPPEDAS